MQQTAESSLCRAVVAGDQKVRTWATSQRPTDAAWLQGGLGVWEHSKMKVAFLEDGLGSGDWQAQLKSCFSSFKMRQLGPGLVPCLETIRKIKKPYIHI